MSTGINPFQYEPLVHQVAGSVVMELLCRYVRVRFRVRVRVRPWP